MVNFYQFSPKIRDYAQVNLSQRQERGFSLSFHTGCMPSASRVMSARQLTDSLPASRLQANLHIVICFHQFPKTAVTCYTFPVRRHKQARHLCILLSTDKRWLSLWRCAPGVYRRTQRGNRRCVASRGRRRAYHPLWGRD